MFYSARFLRLCTGVFYVFRTTQTIRIRLKRKRRQSEVAVVDVDLLWIYYYLYVVLPRRALSIVRIPGEVGARLVYRCLIENQAHATNSPRSVHQSILISERIRSNEPNTDVL